MFTSSDIKSLQEAYQAVYDDELRSEIVEDDDLFEEIYIIEQLEDGEFDNIIEEVVYELLDEGYSIDDLDEIFVDEFFEQMIDEARVTMGRGGESGEGRVTTGTGSRRAAKKRLSDRKARKRSEFVQNAMQKIRNIVDEPARKYAEKRGVVRSKSGKSTLGPGTGVSSISYKQKTPAGRRDVRKAVAKDIAKRAWDRVIGPAKTAKAIGGIAGSIAKDEAKRARRSAEHQAGKAAQAVASAPGRAASAAKSGLKNLIRRGAERVQRGAEGLAKRMSEEVETFDIVLDFLLSEGIVETLEDAQWVMVNELDYEDIDAILEAYEIDEKVIITRGTSTNAAGEKIPFTHKTNTLTGRSTVSDKFGQNRQMERQLLMNKDKKPAKK